MQVMNAAAHVRSGAAFGDTQVSPARATGKAVDATHGHLESSRPYRVGSEPATAGGTTLLGIDLTEAPAQLRTIFRG